VKLFGGIYHRRDLCHKWERIKFYSRENILMSIIEREIIKNGKEIMWKEKYCKK
jgi:hypothetical protein